MKIWMTNGSTGVLQSPFLPSLPPLMRDLPDSRFDKNRRQWTFHATPAACHSLIGGLQAIGVTPEIDEAIEEAAQRWAERLERAAVVQKTPLADFVPHAPQGMKTVPWRHQAKGFEFARHEDGVGLAMYMGCIGGDAEIVVHRAGATRRMSLAKLHRLFHSGRTKSTWKCRSLMGDRFGHNEIKDVLFSGRKSVIKVTLDDGKILRCTPDHEIARPGCCWTQAKNLLAGDEVLVNGATVRKGKDIACPTCGVIRYLPPSAVNRGRLWCRECWFKEASRRRMEKPSRCKDCDGYIRLYIPEHPRAFSGGQVYEHIVVMEKQLGRSIDRSEEVHHKNRIRDDNRVENLEVMILADHKREHDPLLRLDGGSTVNGGKVCIIPKIAKVVSVEPDDEEDTYDLVMADPHRNFVANGVVVHNCGKTLTTLALLCHWRAKKVLIACPKAVLGVWRGETEKHTPGVFRTIVLDKGSGEKKAIQVRNAMRLYSGATIIVANYEAIISGKLGKEMVQHDWDVVVADESHRLKGATTITSKTLYEIGKRSKKRLALSGTPMVQGPIDLYGQMRFLDAGVLGTSVTRFRDRYCVTNPAMPSVIVSYKNQDELKAKYDAMFITVSLDDAALDLPPLSHEKVLIELEPEARRIHDDLWDDSVAKFGDLDELIENMVNDKKDNRVTVGNILTQLLRLSQITSGHVVNDLGEVKRVSTAKKDALTEIASNLPLREPVVVFCRYREDIKIVEEVAAATGKRYGEISGKRKDLTPQSKLPDTVDLVAVQWQSGGAGIDLSRASYGVVYSSTYSGGDFNQGISRLHRPGQKRPTKFYHLIATNTVDQKVYAALARKQKLIERITCS